MKCTPENIEKVFQVLKSQMSDENGRGEFDEDSDLLTAVETVVGWIDRGFIFSHKGRNEKCLKQEKE